MELADGFLPQLAALDLEQLHGEVDAGPGADDVVLAADAEMDGGGGEVAGPVVDAQRPGAGAGAGFGELLGDSPVGHRRERGDRQQAGIFRGQAQQAVPCPRDPVADHPAVARSALEAGVHRGLSVADELRERVLAGQEGPAHA